MYKEIDSRIVCIVLLEHASDIWSITSLLCGFFDCIHSFSDESSILTRYPPKSLQNRCRNKSNKLLILCVGKNFWDLVSSGIDNQHVCHTWFLYRCYNYSANETLWNWLSKPQSYQHSDVKNENNEVLCWIYLYLNS